MPIKSEYTESFSEFTQETKVDILHRKNSDQMPRSHSESEYTERFSEFIKRPRWTSSIGKTAIKCPDHRNSREV